MSDELFEVAFSGQIKDGADLAQVKAKVGAMFKADATKLAHLFSGKRMVIKKNIDQAMANKYKAALDNAGAVCEVKSLSGASAPKVAEPVAQETAPPVAPKPKPTVISGDAPAAPQTDPLGIAANDIADLSAGLAPVGSDMQDAVKEVAEPELDISGIDMAPAGSDLGQVKKDDDPPPPSTEGLSLAD
ncbi:hypothetical protein MNBD_GAMMA08-2011 [hydrothermal vent metagenome]|uniref:Uncharacterized protein n=1 Tax=hydrothermal vent metagenome TaxID=652676 RepID=A0A3B0Y2X9_9ZZZZ